MKAMNAKQSLRSLVLVSSILFLTRFVSAQSSANPPQPPASQQQQSPSDKSSEARNEGLTLTESQKSLMAGSRRAILKTGMSEPYFNEHFHVVAVVDKPGDRRVVWKFSVNEYETTVIDSIGYYSEGAKRVDVHSVESMLLSTSDITRTIPKTRALRIMRSCLGKFADPVVEYTADSSRRAVLVLNAHSVLKPEPPTRLSTGSPGAAKPVEKPSGEAVHDVIREGKKKPIPPIVLGSVHLQTGKCIKGIGQVGSPKPHERLP